MADMTLIEAIRSALDEALAQDERVFVTGEDIGRRGGVFRATQGLYEKYGARRVMDSPLTEMGIVGVGIGAALADLRPVCEIQFADFIHPAFNQIVGEAARMYYRSAGGWHVPLVIRVPYGAVPGGGLYHCQSVEALFAHIPGLKIVVPSTPRDARRLLHGAILDPNPVLFLETKYGYRQIRGEVPEQDAPLLPGPARIAREGDDLSLFAWGLMAHYAEIAAGRAARETAWRSRSSICVRCIHWTARECWLRSARRARRWWCMRTTSPWASAPKSPPCWSTRPSNTSTGR